MKRILIFMVLLNTTLVFSQSLKDYATTNYISLTVPISYNGQIKYLNSTDTIEIKNINDLLHNSSILNSLPNSVSSVTVYEKEKGGSLSLLGNSFSSKNSSYLLIYDFTQTQTIEFTDPVTLQTYSILIGVGVRLIANVTTKKKGLNLTDIFGLALKADSKNIQGSLEVRCNGASSQKINQMIPVTSDFSKSSISSALQSVATIKSHIYDIETKITPQIIAFSINGNKTDKFDFEKINESVNYQF